MNIGIVKEEPIPVSQTGFPLNEGWGQFDANKATALIGSIDPTRFVNEACGWFDQKGGDMYSIHNYAKGLEVQPQEDCVLALTPCPASWPARRSLATSPTIPRKG